MTEHMTAPYCISCGYRHPAGRPEFMVCGERGGATMYTLLHCPSCDRPRHHGTGWQEVEKLRRHMVKAHAVHYPMRDALELRAHYEEEAKRGAS